MTKMDAVQKALNHFWATQAKYAKYGANDSEPRHVFCNLIRQAIKGKPVTVPSDAASWQLYVGSMSCGHAARALHSSAKRVIDLINRYSSHTLENYLFSMLD